MKLNKKLNLDRLIDFFKRTNKAYCFISLIYCMAFSSLIRANYSYYDDLGRITRGYAGWEDWGRYTSVALSHVIHMNYYLTDISPFTEILAIMILALASLIIIYVMNDHNIRFSTMLISVIIGTNPYFLQCMSYKFDCVYMAFSILVSILPVLFLDIICNSYLFILSSFISTMIMCTTYQATAGIYPIIVLLYCARKIVFGGTIKVIRKWIAQALLSYVSALLAFYFFIMRNMPGHSYASTDVSNNIIFIQDTIDNYKHYLHFFISDFSGNKLWIICCFLVTSLCIIGAVVTTNNNRLIIAAFSFFTVLISVVLSVGMYPFISSPSYSPRAMCGIGITIGIFSIYADSLWHDKFLIRVPGLIIAYSFIVFSLTYGNALHEQDKYVEYRLQEVLDDFSSIRYSQSKSQNINVKFSGTIGFSPIINRMPDEYHMIKRLVPVGFSGEGYWYWDTWKFGNYYGISNIKIVNDMKTEEFYLISDTLYHVIYTDGVDSYWIKLK